MITSINQTGDSDQKIMERRYTYPAGVDLMGLLINEQEKNKLRISKNRRRGKHTIRVESSSALRALGEKDRR